MYGPGPSSNVRARHLLLAQSTGAGGPAVEDEAEDGDGDEDEDGVDGAGDRGVEVADIRCFTRSVAEIGWQAVMTTPIINTPRNTLMITPA